MRAIPKNLSAIVSNSVLLTAMAVFASPVLADDQYIDSARVLSVTPQTESVNVPRQECRTEYQQQSYSNSNHSIMGAVIGGVAGGLLGNTVGRGSGRVAAAAVGAGVGAIAVIVSVGITRLAHVRCRLKLVIRWITGKPLTQAIW